MLVVVTVLELFLRQSYSITIISSVRGSSTVKSPSTLSWHSSGDDEVAQVSTTSLQQTLSIRYSYSPVSIYFSLQPLNYY